MTRQIKYRARGVLCSGGEQALRPKSRVWIDLPVENCSSFPENLPYNQPKVGENFVGTRLMHGSHVTEYVKAAASGSGIPAAGSWFPRL
jgi:hypothetical protein